jgi:DNA-binding NarL/FixJ family response regulator
MALTILVADDDPGTRLSISDYLEACGYAVVSAENGKDALLMVEEFQPHLLVTDITMPQMDGYELVKQVRLRPSLRLLPVVFLTGRTETQERVRGYQLGCDVYLSKPFDLSELGAVVRSLLDRAQMIEAGWRSRVQAVAVAIDKVPPPPPLQPASVMPVTPAVDLTQREIDVLYLLSEGLSNIQIGEKLHLSSRTVEKHVSSLLRKTTTSNRAELVRFAMEHHLVGYWQQEG